jgi:hypothetical protein
MLILCLLLLPIKADIIRSLRSRLDIIVDEEENDSNNDLEKPPSQKATQIKFHELRYRSLTKLYTLKWIKSKPAQY